MGKDGYHYAKDCPVIGYGRGFCNKCQPNPTKKVKDAGHTTNQ